MDAQNLCSSQISTLKASQARLTTVLKRQLQMALSKTSPAEAKWANRSNPNTFCPSSLKILWPPREPGMACWEPRPARQCRGPVQSADAQRGCGQTRMGPRALWLVLRLQRVFHVVGECARHLREVSWSKDVQRKSMQELADIIGHYQGTIHFARGGLNVFRLGSNPPAQYI